MRRFPLFALAAVVLATAGCGAKSTPTTSGSANSGPIKIGMIASLTGNYGPLGSEDRKAVELAVQQINDKGGLLGRHVELTVLDDKSAPDQSVLDFNQLKSAGVVSVIGSVFSNSALATIPQVDRDKIPYVSLTPADEQVKPVHPYVFVVPIISGGWAEGILTYFQAQRYTKVAVAYDTKSSYAQAGFAGTQAKAAQHGISLVATEQFQTTTTEFSAVINHVKSSGAEALVVWATGPPSVAFAKQWATAGVNIPLMFTGAQASSLWLKPTGAAAEGMYVASTLSVVAGALPSGPLKQAVDQLNDPFTAKYGYAPPQFAGDGYSGMRLLAAAITKANGTAPDKIRQALEGLSLLTPNGMYKYSATDHAGLDVKYMSINQVKNGAFQPTDWARTQLATIANG